MNRRAPLAVAALLLASGCGGHDAVAALAPPQLSPLLPELLRRAAAGAPAEHAPAALQTLQEYAAVALGLEPAEPRVAARAERALLESPDAIAVLAAQLANPQPAVRQRAAWLLGRTRRALAAFPLLLRQKDETDAETSSWLAQALHRCGNDSGLSWLDAAMDRAASAERAGLLAIELLKELGEPLADAPTYVELQASLRRLADRWQDTGTGSAKDVIAADPAALDAVLAAHLAVTQGTALRPVDEARYVLVRSGRAALPLLRLALGAEEPYLRTMALQVLTEIGLPAHDVAAAILPLLGDPLTSAYAVRALGALAATDTVPRLRALLAVTDTELCAAAAHALGRLRDEGSRPRLQALLADANAAIDIRVQAAFACLCLGDDQNAAAFLAAREQQRDYHQATLAQLRELLARVRAQAARR